MSGSGKSTWLRQIIRGIVDNNDTNTFEFLSFQFEMIGIDEVARDISAKINLSIKQLYSAGKKLEDDQIALVDEAIKSLENMPISIVDKISSVAEIRDTILYYYSANELIKKDKGLVVTLDHTLLCKAMPNQDDRKLLEDLMRMLVEIKTTIASMGGKFIGIILSQLNRDIESPERVLNPKLHYPNKNDIFGSSAVYYSSDYVIIIHRPAVIDGMGAWYGPGRDSMPMGYPVFNPLNGSQPLIYAHIIKERFGSPKILTYLDDLKHSKILELDTLK